MSFYNAVNDGVMKPMVLVYPNDNADYSLFSTSIYQNNELGKKNSSYVFSIWTNS